MRKRLAEIRRAAGASQDDADVSRRRSSLAGGLALIGLLLASPGLSAQGGPTLSFFVQGPDGPVRPGQEFSYDFGVGYDGGAMPAPVGFELKVYGDVKYRRLGLRRGPVSFKADCQRERPEDDAALRIVCPASEASRGEILIALRLYLEATDGPQEIWAEMEPGSHFTRLPGGTPVGVDVEIVATEVQVP